MLYSRVLRPKDIANHVKKEKNEPFKLHLKVRGVK